MRFVLAIVTFVVAAALIGVGIAQRTIWAAPSATVAQVMVSGGKAFTVIDGSVLNAHSGQQTLQVAGSKKQFVAYGRTADVKAWIGDEKYAELKYNALTNKLTSHIVTPKERDDSSATPTPNPTETADPAQAAAPADTAPDAAAKNADANPAGSDLWLEQFVGEDAALTKLNAPDSISVIIASDGTAPAPKAVQLTWPRDNATPFAGPLIVGGLILLLIGLVLYLFALKGMRRARGPRRKGGPKMPKLPKSPRYKPTKAVETAPKGRRSIRRSVVAIPTVLIGSLLFTGCSAEYWPDFSSQPTPTVTPTALATDIPGQGKDAPPPAVTAPQLDGIITNISTVATEADAKLDTDLMKTRFTGAALAERTANYAIRAKKTDAAAPQPIPAGPVVVGLPQATDTWPRVVSAVVGDKSNPKVAPLDVVLVQESPRENYKVEYAVSLEASAKVPDLAPISIGASVVPPKSKLLKIAPDKLNKAYSDVLMNGAKSKDADLFDEKTDGLSKQVGAAYKAQQIAALPATASLAYAPGETSGTPIAMATNESGALIATSVTETATVTAVEEGAKVAAGSVTAALTGVNESTTGLATTYEYQLLFYVPPADSKAKIRLLGFSQAPIAAKEL